MLFSDIHIHALYNCDDGAKSLDYMYKMIDRAYDDGERYMCLTPHCHPGYFGENTDRIRQSFELLLRYTNEKYPDLHIALGNEMRFSPGCVEWLGTNRCLCMNNTKYVLVDFLYDEEKGKISNGLESLLSRGYIPILAHAERYKQIRGNINFIKEQRENGVLIQMDTMSVCGEFGYITKLFAKKILQNYLVDFISSDAHGLHKRPPGIKNAYECIVKMCGKDYAEKICFKNAVHMIFGH